MDAPKNSQAGSLWPSEGRILLINKLISLNGKWTGYTTCQAKAISRQWGETQGGLTNKPHTGYISSLSLWEDRWCRIISSIHLQGEERNREELLFFLGKRSLWKTDEEGFSFLVFLWCFVLTLIPPLVAGQSLFPLVLQWLIEEWRERLAGGSSWQTGPQITMTDSPEIQWSVVSGRARAGQRQIWNQ